MAILRNNSTQGRKLNYSSNDSNDLALVYSESTSNNLFYKLLSSSIASLTNLTKPRIYSPHGKFSMTLMINYAIAILVIIALSGQAAQGEYLYNVHLKIQIPIRDAEIFLFFLLTLPFFE